MAARNVSPGGALLRASRIFSIPAPLPKPASEIASTVLYNSDTATLPHPTHLTITTPPSSLSRGDWGLKRSLPLRSTTKSSTPLIRVGSIDTLEHITEYQSAADHALTLQKWQEMNMPLSMPGTREDRAAKMSSRRIPGGSVFEEDLSPNSAGRTAAKPDDMRWQFGGPWLARLTVGEFNEYVQKTIRERKAEFHAFLKENKAREDTKAAQQAAREKGEDFQRPLTAKDITDEQLRIYVRELRRDPAALFRLIGFFLDLPPAPSPSGFVAEQMAHFVESMNIGPRGKTPTIRSEDFLPTSNSPYSETGPPKTHPSAGLSYLRTNNYIYNHPVHGPQERPPPIEGRIIMPKIPEKQNFVPKVGIAGVVADAPTGDGFTLATTSKSRYGQERRPTYPGLSSLEPDRVGGSKLWLHPERATIDSNGQIDLKVASGDGPALAVHQGRVNEMYNLGRQPMQHIKPLPQPKTATPKGYGLESQGASGKGQGRSGLSGSSISPQDAIKQLRSLFDSNDKEQ
jgi:Mitochondrial ribosomal protein subunit